MKQKYSDRFLSIAEVCEMVGCSRSTVFRKEDVGDFPPRRKLGNQAGPRGRVVYLESEVLAWMHSRMPVQPPFLLPPRRGHEIHDA